ncbi:MAG: flagellar hook protein, partial [Proteobacteria bacterium]|nr:flagellar hook protein [Pseudomonadota bacterium]
MASSITLSAGVRQNLLSLQNTATLASLTQGRLATGKKVNSALDNPTNFFTSQALSDRASDLNSLLDSIGQAQKTLEASDKGITSLTKLVESAKSIAKQARQAAQPAATFASVNSNANIAAAANLNGDEVIGSLTGNNTSLTSANFSPIAIAKTATIATETLGTTGNGSAITVADSTLYSFTVNINGAGA